MRFRNFFEKNQNKCHDFKTLMKSKKYRKHFFWFHLVCYDKLKQKLKERNNFIDFYSNFLILNQYGRGYGSS